MFYNYYQVYITIDPVFKDKLNVKEIFEAVKRYVDKFGNIPTEIFVSDQFNEQAFEFEPEKTVKLVPTKTISSSREIWIGVNPIEQK